MNPDPLRYLARLLRVRQGNTYLYERVRTFPDVVAFGTARANSPGRAPQTLMIYKVGGSDFQVKLSSDVPALNLKSERGPKGDRYQVTVSLIGHALKAGPIKGSITVETNDPEFPKLSVPRFRFIRNARRWSARSNPRLSAALGLEFAGIDLKVTPDNINLFDGVRK